MNSSTFGGAHTALDVCIRDFVEMGFIETSLRWNKLLVSVLLCIKKTPRNLINYL